jgi:RimJ/RimL family protein N-acetyltransferase
MLLNSPTLFQGCAVIEDALPPAFLLERAVARNCTDWQMPRLFVDDVCSEIVGSGCFKSEPRDRKVEIGYGVSKRRCGQGVATEGVTLMIAQAFMSSLVDVVLASSLHSNTASRRVLEKCGFLVYGTGVDDEGPVELWSRAKQPNQAIQPTAPSHRG